MSTLDKWIKEEPKPSWNVHIYIDYHDLAPYFKEQEKAIDYENLYSYLENQFGKNIVPYLYIGAYSEEYVPRHIAERQKKHFNYLTRLGFRLRTCIKYIKNSHMLTVKGAEVSLGIDLMQHAHEKENQKDTAILLCGEWNRYRKIVDTIKKKYGVKLKIFSLAQEYEDNYQTFLDFISKVGAPLKTASDKKKEDLKSIKPGQFSDMLAAFNETSLRQRMKRSQDAASKKPLNTFVYIDYGNIHHSLIDLKRNNARMKNLTESDLFLILKQKAEARNNVIKSVLFMGTPLLKIDELKVLRKKNERLKKFLEQKGFEVHFLYNEVLFKGGMKERGVDLSIGISIIQAALEQRFEKVILISGDADFVPVVQKLKELNKEIEIWSFTKPENNSALSPFLITEMSKHGNIYHKIKSINSLLRC